MSLLPPIAFVLLLGLSGPAEAGVKEFTLTVQQGSLTLDGVEFSVWTFNGKIPGPEIRVKEGDTVRIRLLNKSGARHALYFHGLRVPPRLAAQEQEPVPPDHEYTYEFTAEPSGTHIYHCNWNMAEHLDGGLYGPLIVENRKEQKVDKEFVYVIDEWNSKVASGHSAHHSGHPRNLADYDIMTVNDQVVSNGRPMTTDVRKGDTVRVRLISVGSLPHTLRATAPFLVTHEDGYPVPSRRTQESLTLFSGKRYDIVLTVPDGGWDLLDSVRLPSPLRETATPAAHGRPVSEAVMHGQEGRARDAEGVAHAEHAPTSLLIKAEQLIIRIKSN